MVIAALDAPTRDQRALFDAVAEAARRSGSDVAITIAAADGTAVAWAGRPQAVPDSRQNGGPTLVLAPGALGLRLVYVEPVRITSQGTARVVGAIAAEQLLSPASTVAARDALEARFETSLLPVTLTPRFLGVAAGATRHLGRHPRHAYGRATGRRRDLACDAADAARVVVATPGSASAASRSP